MYAKTLMIAAAFVVFPDEHWHWFESMLETPPPAAPDAAATAPSRAAAPSAHPLSTEQTAHGREIPTASWRALAHR